MPQESQRYRVKCGLKWRGFLGMPMRATPPLAETVVDADSLTFYVMDAKKYDLRKEEVLALRSDSGLLSCGLEIECQKEDVPSTLKVIFVGEEKLEELKAALIQFGWEMED